MAIGKNVGKLEAYLGLDSSEFYASLTGAQAAMTKASSSMKSIGKSLTTYVTLPLLAVGGATVKMAMDFEKTFAEIEGLVGLSRKEVNAFREDVLALAGATSRAPQELAEALYFVTSSGIQGKEALDVLEMSAKASAAGLGETQVVADLLSSALNAYAEEGLTAAEATDTLVAAVREGKAEGSEMSKYLGDVLSVAAKMGVPFRDVGASVAVMTRTGVDAATAVTNLRQILSSLLDPSQEAEKALDEMGTSSAELRKQIKEGGLLSVLQFLEKQTENNEEAMSKVFGNIRALAGAMEIVSVNAEENAQVFANMTDNTGDMNRAFEVVSNTANFKFNQAMADLKVAGIELGTALLPVFTDILDLVKRAARWFTNLSEEGKKMVLMAAAMLAALGPVLMMLGSLVGVLTALASPIGLVVVAIGVLAASFIYLYENWEAVKERFTDWSWWKNLFIDMADHAVFIFSDLIRLLSKAWWVLKDSFTSAINGFISSWNLLASVSKGVLGPIEELTQKEWKDPLEGIYNGLEKLRGKTVKYKHEFKGFTESITDFAKKAGDAILGLFPSGGGGGGRSSTSSTGAVAPGVVSNKPFEPKERGSITFSDSDSEDQTYQDSSGKYIKDWRQLTEVSIDMNDAMQALAHTMLNDVAAGFEAIGAGALDASQLGLVFLSSIADFGVQLGKQIIMIALAMESFKKLVWANPGAAVAAGIALIAGMSLVTGMIKKRSQGGGGAVKGLATGGSVTKGGVFQLHKNEMVSLPRGAAVTPAHMTTSANAGGGNGSSLSTKINLRSLIIQIDRERQRMGR
jgi:phage tail tape measure protein, TP901 family, core region